MSEADTRFIEIYDGGHVGSASKHRTQCLMPLICGVLVAA